MLCLGCSQVVLFADLDKLVFDITLRGEELLEALVAQECVQVLGNVLLQGADSRTPEPGRWSLRFALGCAASTC